MQKVVNDAGWLEKHQHPTEIDKMMQTMQNKADIWNIKENYASVAKNIKWWNRCKMMQKIENRTNSIPSFKWALFVCWAIFNSILNQNI